MRYLRGMSFETMRLPLKPTVQAPDGSDVRVLLQLAGGSMAHFELAPGLTSIAVCHRTVEELWYFLDGQGEMWRKADEREETVLVEAGVCISIPVGTSFQFRSSGSAPLRAVAVTMPPWPGMEEAFGAEGPWMATAR